MASTSQAPNRFSAEVRAQALEHFAVIRADEGVSVARAAQRVAEILGTDGPSAHTVRSWAQQDGIVPAPQKRKPKKNGRSRQEAAAEVVDEVDGDEVGDEVEEVADDDEVTYVDLDAYREEVTAPLREEIARKDREIGRLLDGTVDSDADLLARNKQLEEEVAALRALVKVYL